MRDWIESLFILGAVALFIWTIKSGDYSLFVGSGCMVLLAYLVDEETKWN